MILPISKDFTFLKNLSLDSIKLDTIFKKIIIIINSYFMFF